MDIESYASGDLLGTLGGDTAHDLADLAPGLAVLVLEFQGDALPYSAQHVVDGDLGLSAFLVPLDGVADGVEDASHDGDGGFQGFGHSLRVGGIPTLFKTALDAIGGVLYLRGRASSWNLKAQLTPTGPRPSGCAHNRKNGPARDSYIADRPSPPGSSKGPLMAAADSTGVITHARTTSPSRRPIAAGIIGRRAGRTVTITRTASGTRGSVDLPVRIPGATRPPKPSVPPPVADDAAPDFSPVVFHTAKAGELTSEVPVADWRSADFEVYENYALTARRIPAAEVDAAMSRLLEVVPYLEADSEFNYVVGYDLARDAA